MSLSDFVTFFFLIVTVLLFLQLRSVLGKRTGHEKPPVDVFSIHKKISKISKKDEQSTFISVEKEGVNEDFSAIDAVAPIGSSLNQSLREVISVYPNFEPEDFIKGVRVAYEIIVVAFSDGDLSEVKNLLCKEVYEDFSIAISERKIKDKNVKSSLVGIETVKIVDAKVKQSNIYITSRLVSQFISVTYDKDGILINEEPEISGKVIDRWTFAREILSGDPNWKLAATESEH